MLLELLLSEVAGAAAREEERDTLLVEIKMR
jgi:hypothetical protein